MLSVKNEQSTFYLCLQFNMFLCSIQIAHLFPFPSLNSWPDERMSWVNFARGNDIHFPQKYKSDMLHACHCCLASNTFQRWQSSANRENNKYRKLHFLKMFLKHVLLYWQVKEEEQPVLSKSYETSRSSGRKFVFYFFWENYMTAVHTLF